MGWHVKLKKALGILIIFLIFIMMIFLQINFFNWFTISGIKANIFILLVLFIGLYLNKTYGFILGAIFGMILDYLFGRVIGIYGVMLAIIRV